MMNWSRTAAGAEQDQCTDVLPHDNDVDVDHDHTQTHTLKVNCSVK